MTLSIFRRSGQSVRRFSHADAQTYERKFAAAAIYADFPRVWADHQEAMASGSLWHGPDDQWFQGDTVLWERFVEHVRGKLSLEIGSGPFGYLGPARWIERRAIIDPLVDFYRSEELRAAGGTFFDESVETYAQPAEEPVPELRASVEGCIVCRNALDHTEDPLAVLGNLADYAVPGCYFLFWTDLWHLNGPNEGHRNITRRPEVIDALLDGLGFEILKRGVAIRSSTECVEYGRLARKRP